MTDQPVPRRSSWFFVEVRGPRSRRPIDLTLVVGGLVLLALCAGAATHRGRLERSAAEMIDRTTSAELRKPRQEGDA